MTQRTLYDPLKRTIDVTVAGIGLLVTAPLQLAIALAIRICLGVPVLFRQPRPGRNEEIFEIIKFRTMKSPKPEAGLVSDEERMTTLGSFLRSTSLDELPTLWNVLRGDMSLVGPRPLLVKYLDRYSTSQRRRHEVRPGITGLAQVSGRNAISWEEKLEYDVAYVEQRSLVLDLRVLLRTVGKTLRRDGIAASGRATVDEFLGSGATND